MAISAYTTRMASQLNGSDRPELHRLQFPSPSKGDDGPGWKDLSTVQEAPMEAETLSEGVTKEEFSRRQANVSKSHKAAGHPSNRNTGEDRH